MVFTQGDTGVHMIKIALYDGQQAKEYPALGECDSNVLRCTYARDIIA